MFKDKRNVISGHESNSNGSKSKTDLIKDNNIRKRF